MKILLLVPAHSYGCAFYIGVVIFIYKVFVHDRPRIFNITADIHNTRNQWLLVFDTDAKQLTANWFH